MTRKKTYPPNWLERYGINLTTLGFVILSGCGFYFTTIGTLNEHTKTLEELKATNRDSVKEREKVRSDFVANSEKTASGIAALNTKTEVQSTQLVAIKESLDRINRTLETVTVQKR